MLTLDLLRFRIRGDSIQPIFLASGHGSKFTGAAAKLIEVFRSSVGGTVGELEDDLDEALGSSPDYKVYRGLAKILHEYAVIEPAAEMDYEELRRSVFTLAVEMGPPARTPDLLFPKPASDKIAEIARRLGRSLGLPVPAEKLPSMLYADLRENRLIRDFDSSLEPSELIERYNTALAQAMLYRATRMVVDVYDNYRIIFRYAKLARLMHSIKVHDGGYRIHFNGPLSLFANVERYGISMAKLLPAVLKCERWELHAKVNFGEGEKLFHLTPAAGLKSHYRDEPEFDSSPEEAFFRKFERNKKSKWTIRREGSVLDLKGTVMIPDFVFTHKDGRTAHLEIVGFWTPEYLEKKLDKLRRAEETNIVVAVPDSLNCSRDEFSAPVVRYKQRLLIKDVLPALDAVAKQDATMRGS